MTTTAEGIETEDQQAIVKASGCTEMQGYLFSEPRPAKEIARLLSRETITRLQAKARFPHTA
ncbi:MAG TPA: hypothetical protein VKR55_20990 [Bradyrhizobium sp.]|nr:hypothetical protein [Bradyrhizobium sp.]HLZ04608.1 hypothetical protein [Bradyrhizobium sp.]